MAGHGGELLVALERIEDRLVPSVDLGEAGHPGPQGNPAVEIGTERIERLVSGLVRQLESSGETEISSAEIGELVMAALRELDPVAVGELVASRVIIDGRNCLDATAWRAAGWTYIGMGRP